jgi:hypothetical protein
VRFTGDRAVRAVDPEHTGLFGRWLNFWFTPVDPVALNGLRVLTGILLIGWLVPLAGHVEEVFAPNAWLDATGFMEMSRIDPLQQPTQEWSLPRWSLLFLSDNPRFVQTIYGLALAVFGLFALGVATRLTAFFTWLLVASLTANPVLRYEGDTLITVLSFYLMIGYLLLGQSDPRQSLWTRILGPRPLGVFGWSRPSSGPMESIGANVAVRLLQVHFAIIMLTSGLHKLQFGDWWGGHAFWYALYPPFESTREALLRHKNHPEAYLFFLSLGAYLTLAWQIGFALFAWRRGWRLVLLGGAAAGWLGMATVYRLPLIGPAIFVFCLGFLTPQEWRATLQGLATWPGLGWLSGHAAAPAVRSVSQKPAPVESVPDLSPSPVSVEQPT